LERSHQSIVDVTRRTFYAWLIEGDMNGSQSEEEIDKKEIREEDIFETQGAQDEERDTQDRLGQARRDEVTAYKESETRRTQTQGPQGSGRTDRGATLA
jgi:hypothetical protein